MVSKQYVLREFGHGWTAQKISNELTELGKKGLVVERFEVTPSWLEISRHPDSVPGLNDGDTITIHNTIRVLLARGG